LINHSFCDSKPESINHTIINLYRFGSEDENDDDMKKMLMKEKKDEENKWM
jgi:hypothetical protein